MLEDLGLSRTMISTIYTAGSLSAAMLMFAIGRLLDKFGARIMLTIVGLLFGLALMWMSHLNNPIELFFGIVAIRTLGQGSLTLIPTTLVAIWFIRLRGKATALASLGGGICQAILPLITHMLISQLGWRNAWVVQGLMVWLILIIPVITLIRRGPESVGQLPDGDQYSIDPNKLTQRTYVNNERNWTLKDAIHTRTFWLLIFTGSSPALIITALVFHQVSIFDNKGLDPSVAAEALTVMAIGTLSGTLLSGILTDRLEARYIVASSHGIIIIGMLFSFSISREIEAIIYGGLLGLGFGIFLTSSTVIWANYFGRKHLGSIRGIATSCVVAFAALGPMPFGILFDLTGDYTIAIASFLILPLACGLAALYAKAPRINIPIRN
jgi:sugar phosphate permease